MFTDAPVRTSDRQVVEGLSVNLSSEVRHHGRCFQLGERIYWGDALAAYDKEFIERRGITHVLSIASPQSILNSLPADSLLTRNEINVARFESLVPLSFERGAHLDAAAELLAGLHDDGHTIYVHCLKGEVRTPQVISAAIRSYGLKVEPITPRPDDSLSALTAPSLQAPKQPDQGEITILSSNNGVERVFAAGLSFSGGNVGTNTLPPDRFHEILQKPDTLVCIDALSCGTNSNRHFGEALDLADALVKRGTPVFLFSALSLPAEVSGGSKYYADVGSDDGVIQRLAAVHRGQYDFSKAAADFRLLRSNLERNYGRLVGQHSLGHDA